MTERQEFQLKVLISILIAGCFVVAGAFALDSLKMLFGGLALLGIAAVAMSIMVLVDMWWRKPKP